MSEHIDVVRARKTLGLPEQVKLLREALAEYVVLGYGKCFVSKQLLATGRHALNVTTSLTDTGE